jgi:hypothetical protein
LVSGESFARVGSQIENRRPESAGVAPLGEVLAQPDRDRSDR